jgi:hypothetical protein
VDEIFGKFYINSNIDQLQDYSLKISPENEKGIKSKCRKMKK